MADVSSSVTATGNGDTQDLTTGAQWFWMDFVYPDVVVNGNTARNKICNAADGFVITQCQFMVSQAVTGGTHAHTINLIDTTPAGADGTTTLVIPAVNGHPVGYWDQLSEVIPGDVIAAKVPVGTGYVMPTDANGVAHTAGIYMSYAQTSADSTAGLNIRVGVQAYRLKR